MITHPSSLSRIRGVPRPGGPPQRPAGRQRPDLQSHESSSHHCIRPESALNLGVLDESGVVLTPCASVSTKVEAEASTEFEPHLLCCSWFSIVLVTPSSKVKVWPSKAVMAVRLLFTSQVQRCWGRPSRTRFPLRALERRPGTQARVAPRCFASQDRASSLRRPGRACGRTASQN